MKIATIIGARPQFVKAAVVSREIQKHSNIEEVIIHTGQHFDKNMSDIFFEQMRIPEPRYNLEIGTATHGAMTGRMLERIERILIKEEPDWVLVYGDTNSTLAGALASKKLHIKIAHIEAGLRSFNMQMPEEVNRILTDRISNLLLCPTKTAVKNLKKEGFEKFNCKIVESGDVMYDAALYYKKYVQKPHSIKIKNNFVLATIHREENTNNTTKLKNIIDAFNKIAQETQIIVPLHPRTRKVIGDYKIKINFDIIEPVGYLEMIYLLQNCQAVMTDSGGLQKEAFFFKKPCVTLRDETEWVELIENKVNTLAGTDKNRILSIYYNTMKNKIDFDIELYGTGNTASQIVNEIQNG